MANTKKVVVASSALLLAAAALWPAAAEAQGHRGRSGRTVFVRGYFGAFFGPFGSFYGWSPYAFGYAPYGFAPYGYAPYGPRRYDNSASARVQVKPKQTEVYVDGYLAGIADDFDGTFQRLDLRPGGHEITLYLDGHRSVTERIYFSPGRTQKIKVAMVPLAAGDPPQARPEPPPRRTQRRTAS